MTAESLFAELEPPEETQGVGNYRQVKRDDKNKTRTIASLETVRLHNQYLVFLERKNQIFLTTCIAVLVF